MTLPKSILLLSASALLASTALAEATTGEFTPVEPAVIEQLATPQDSQQSVPEPGVFGAICLGIAAVIYSRRWRHRT